MTMRLSVPRRSVPNIDIGAMALAASLSAATSRPVVASIIEADSLSYLSPGEDGVCVKNARLTIFRRSAESVLPRLFDAKLFIFRLLETLSWSNVRLAVPLLCHHT